MFITPVYNLKNVNSSVQNICSPLIIYRSESFVKVQEVETENKNTFRPLVVLVVCFHITLLPDIKKQIRFIDLAIALKP